jgi:hypothetical protein
MRQLQIFAVFSMFLIAKIGYAQDNYSNTSSKTESPIGTLEYKGAFQLKAQSIKPLTNWIDRESLRRILSSCR